MKTWTLTVDENGMITFPDDFIEQTGWKIGDTIKWIDNADGSWSLIKKEIDNAEKKENRT